MKCKSKNKKGIQCKAYATDNGYCFWHSKDHKENARQAQIKGGGNRKTLYDLEEIVISGISDLPEYLVRVINEVRKGEADVKLGNAQGYLAGHLIKAFYNSELEKRIEAIENKLNDNGLNNDT